MSDQQDDELFRYTQAFYCLFIDGPGYVARPPYDNDAHSYEVSVFINDTWEDYRPTLFSLEGMFGDGTTFGIEFTEQDWKHLVEIVEAKRKERTQ